MIFTKTVYYLLFISFIFSEVDHLLLTRVVTSPDHAESISIHNPTSDPINLSDYYISDSENYYRMQTESVLSPSSEISGYTARFPDIEIPSNQTLVLVFNEDYSVFYEDFIPDLLLFGSNDNSMIEPDDNAFGFSNNKIDDNAECIILFEWDGNLENNIKDIDYFVWATTDGITTAIDKTDIGTYLDDTSLLEQKYFQQVPSEYSAFSRKVELDEIGEVDVGGNGIWGNDETSENFRESWEIISIAVLGCMDPDSPNYDPDATIDDNSCISSEGITEIYEIQENIDTYNGQEVTVVGMVTIGDDLLYPGKTKFYIQDQSDRGIQIYNSSELSTTYLKGDYIQVTGEVELFGTDVEITGPTITLLSTGNDLPEPYLVVGNEPESMNGTWAKVSGFLTDYWHYTSDNTDFTQLTISDDNNSVDVMFWASAVSPELLDEFENYVGNDSYNFEAYGVIGFYEGNVQLQCAYLSDLSVSENVEVASDEFVFNISNHPFLPSKGEEIEYTYSVPNGYRCVIRIFDISGRFITTLFEGVPVFLNVPQKNDTWDGRNHLGELSPPGIYLIHMDAIEIASGKSFTEISPVVIGNPVQ